MNALKWGLAAVTVLVALGLAGLAFRALRAARHAHVAGSAPEPAGPPFPWRIEARLEQASERNPDLETSRLTVVLRDARGREVETPDLRLELNGGPLAYSVGQGNYYDRHPSYRLREDDGFRFAPDTTYELVARRGEEAPVPLASLRTPKELGLGNLRLPASHRGDRDLVIAWTGLGEPAELLVTRTLEYVDDLGNQVTLEGGPYGDDAVRRRIGGRGLSLPDGSTTIPASYFAAKEGRVTALRVEVTATVEGRLLCRPLEPSTVAATRRVALPVDVSGAPPR